MKKLRLEEHDTQQFSNLTDNERLYQEANHLRNTKTFFPEPVWIHVLKKITSHNDIENCSNASPFFWKFLEKKREEVVVLPKVFLHLIDHFKKEESIKFYASWKEDDNEDSKDDEENSEDAEEDSKDDEENCKDAEEDSKDAEEDSKDDEENCKDAEEDSKDAEEDSKDDEKNSKDDEKNSKDDEKNCKDDEKNCKDDEKNSKDDNKDFIVNIHNNHDWIGNYDEDKWFDFRNYCEVEFCILKCREVCKMWNRVIEDLYQSQEAGYFVHSYESIASVKTQRFFTGAAYDFDPHGKIQKFLHHFDSTRFSYQDMNLKKNPFMARKVEFSRINARNYGNALEIGERFINDITMILEKYGSEIWYIDFNFYADIDDCAELLYLQLRQFLQLLPNLKVLRVRFRDDSGDFAEEPNTELISQNPLPALNSLKFLYSENLPTNIFNQLIHKSINIKTLEVVRTVFHMDYNIFSTNLYNLTTLSVQFVSITDFEKFENCNKVLNIKRFSFWYLMHKFLPWSRVFHALESKLGENCEELLLLLPTPRSSDNMKQVLVDSYSFRLNLRKLEKITIFDDTPCCLDFLLPCKNVLQSISLKYDELSGPRLSEERFDKQQQIFRGFGGYSNIQFVGYKTKLDESNIWTEFPKLRNITLHEIKGKRLEANCLFNRKGDLSIKKHVVLLRNYYYN